MGETKTFARNYGFDPNGFTTLKNSFVKKCLEGRVERKMFYDLEKSENNFMEKKKVFHG
jgi:hypothetical protein